MRACVNELEAALPDFAWPNYVLGNHDQPRLATRFGGQPQARLAGMMLLTLRGTPTFYYGDEIGMENGYIPLEKIQDPQGKNLGAHRTRDVARTPMQWNDSAYAGFSTTEPWLPVSEDHQTRNVAAQMQESTSMLNFYRKLFWLRRESPALLQGSYRPIDLPDAEAQRRCFVYLREFGQERKLVVLNFSDGPVTARIGLEGSGRLALATGPGRPATVPLHVLELGPHEGLVFDL
jgi:alpha-glucosidase